MAEGNGRTWSPKIVDLCEQIVALKLGEAVEMSDCLEQKYGIKPAAAGVAVAALPSGPAPAAAAEPVKTEFTPVLEGLADPTKKINVIKVVREITGLGLKEAKDLVEGAPKPIKENISKDEAEAIKKKLEDGGAKVTLK
jgi:large subunit ribosomal protein L7/L12